MVEGLKPDTQYSFRVNFTNEEGKLYDSEGDTFQTATKRITGLEGAPKNKPQGLNISLPKNGGRINNYGNAGNDGQWGVGKAIDGDALTEWSSYGVGNNAG